MSDLDAALTAVARALGGTVGHVNYGESEDYMRGFNDGYDHADQGQPFRVDPANVPAREPHRTAYLRGYAAGYGWAYEAPNGAHD